METAQITTAANLVISPAQFFEHWQGHRKLTRKLIEVFPEDQFFTYAIGGMRPAVELIMEMADLADGGIEGMATGRWKTMEELGHCSGNYPKTKAGILTLWDDVTQKIDALSPQISAERFQEIEIAFGLYEGPVYSSLLYFIDNEIHHRGQAYVYLRALGVEPPAFWER
jgi:hypothetical protein